jgi:hypothetical protein
MAESPRSAGVDRFDAPARTFQPVLILACEKTSAALDVVAATMVAAVSTSRTPEERISPKVIFCGLVVMVLGSSGDPSRQIEVAVRYG